MTAFEPIRFISFQIALNEICIARQMSVAPDSCLYCIALHCIAFIYILCSYYNENKQHSRLLTERTHTRTYDVYSSFGILKFDIFIYSLSKYV